MVALVGRDKIHEYPVFPKATMQATRLDHFMGIAPISHRNLADRGADGSIEWVAKAERMQVEWSGAHSTGTFYYSYVTSLDPYALSVKFAPWLAVVSEVPLDARQWYEQWCHPLTHLISVATGGVEKTTLLTLKSNSGAEYSVFASPITQAPFYSDKRADDFLAFTASTDGFSLIGALEQWLNLHASGHPLITGYNAHLLNKDQHPRARLLTLLQWLEASFGFEHKNKFSADQEEYSRKRAELMEKAKRLTREQLLTASDLRFIKRLPKYVQPTLAEAIRYYVSEHPDLNLVKILKTLDILSQTHGDDDPILALCAVRNGLSHGTENYDTYDLHQLADALRPLVRAEFLRLLGGTFNPDVLRFN